jgi:hypothetical protein
MDGKDWVTTMDAMLKMPNDEFRRMWLPDADGLLAVPAIDSDPEPQFFTEAIYGYRTWQMDADTLQLKALSWGTPWPYRGPIVSEHVTKLALTDDCSRGEPCTRCGIWAFDSYAHVERHQRGGMPPMDYVRGVVAGWGRVHICSNGWRAGYAYPLALLNWPTEAFANPEATLDPEGLRWHFTMHRIASRYGIPVVESVQELVNAARDMGCVPVHDDPLFAVPETIE